MHRLLSALFAVATLAAPVVHAQEVAGDPDRERRARLHYESATAYFEIGDYESALREFRAAYDESPHAELLYNVYLCEERLGHLGAAIEALATFLETPDVPRRELLERRLAYMRERASRGETSTEATEVEHPLEVEVPDAPEGSEPAASTTSSAPIASAPPAPAGSTPVLAITGFVIAAAGLVSFGVAGGITLAEDARLGACRPSCQPSEVDTITASAIAVDVSLGVALVGAVLGVIGLVVEGGGPPAAGTARLRGLGLEGSF